MKNDHKNLTQSAKSASSQSLGFRELQKSLTEAIINPAESNHFEARRLKVYQELVFNNAEGFCANAFPVLKTVFTDAQWHSLIRAFLIYGEKSSPYFVDIAEQFLLFLTGQHVKESGVVVPPYLHELAHYEWVELTVSLQEPPTKNDEWHERSTLNVPDSTWALAYHYPVHTIKAERIAELKPIATCLVVYLDHQGEVCFLHTNHASIYLLNYIEQRNNATFNDLLSYFQSNEQDSDPETISNFLRSALKDFSDKGVIVIE